ncbi:MAG: hypothetical protein VB071_00645, partial [Lawsonibacter sp.]|nr:hypothetical protein [Lawsonibacter sp.]
LMHFVAFHTKTRYNIHKETTSAGSNRSTNHSNPMLLFSALLPSGHFIRLKSMIEFIIARGNHHFNQNIYIFIQIIYSLSLYFGTELPQHCNALAV